MIPDIPPEALAIVRRYRTCELATLAKDGTPIAWPVCARLLDDGTLLLTTAIGLPQKAFNIRRDARVSLSFSDPTGSGLGADSGAVLVQGRATVTDTPMHAYDDDPEVRAYFVENIFARQPSGSFMSSWLGRWFLPWYYLRLVVRVTPEVVTWWPDRDFPAEPRRFEVSDAR